MRDLNSHSYYTQPFSKRRPLDLLGLIYQIKRIIMNITNIFQHTQEEFDLLKTKDQINLLCEQCNQTYTRRKKDILDTFTRYKTYPKGCSKECISKLKRKKVICENCKIIFYKLKHQTFDLKYNFCTSSCSATYNNKNKTYGYRRSKLEIYIEKQLTLLYPDLEILYSNKQIIGSELDIYIPSLKIAFEIQGIFHYEPIFGQEKLEQIQKNDLEKIKKCKELNIKLIHIDTRSQKNFTEKSSLIYIDKITKLINGQHA